MTGTVPTAPILSYSFIVLYFVTDLKGHIISYYDVFMAKSKICLVGPVLVGKYNGYLSHLTGLRVDPQAPAGAVAGGWKPFFQWWKT